jgi:hypothetical protein
MQSDAECSNDHVQSMDVEDLRSKNAAERQRPMQETDRRMNRGKERKKRNLDRKIKEGVLEVEDVETALDVDEVDEIDEVDMRELKRSEFSKEVHHAILQVENSRWTRHDRLLAFAMARHHRLGANSFARMLPKDVFSVIAHFVHGLEVFVYGGVEMKENKNDYYEDNNFELDHSVVLDGNVPSLNCWMWRGGNRFEELPPMPEQRFNATALYYNGSNGAEVWCVGGYTKCEMDEESALVFSFERREWRTMDGVACRKGPYVLYENTILSLGGWNLTAESPPGCFYTIEGDEPWRALPERPAVHCGSTMCILLGDILVVRDWVSSLQNEDEDCFWIDLRKREPVWTPFCSGIPVDEYSQTPAIFRGKLFLVGGVHDLECPCGCAIEMHIVREFSMNSGQFEFVDEWKLPLGLTGARVACLQNIVTTLGSKRQYMLQATHILQLVENKWRPISVKTGLPVENVPEEASSISKPYLRLPKNLWGPQVVQVGF